MEHTWPQGREEAQDCGQVSMGMGNHDGLFARSGAAGMGLEEVSKTGS